MNKLLLTDDTLCAAEQGAVWAIMCVIDGYRELRQRVTESEAQIKVGDAIQTQLVAVTQERDDLLEHWRKTNAEYERVSKALLKIQQERER